MLRASRIDTGEGGGTHLRARAEVAAVALGAVLVSLLYVSAPPGSPPVLGAHISIIDTRPRILDQFENLEGNTIHPVRVWNH